MAQEVFAKPERRSPIKVPPRRLPGQSVREEVVDLVFDKWMPYGLYPGVFAILAVMEWIRWELRLPPTLGSAILLTVITATAALISIRRIRRVQSQIAHLHLGLEGEISIGQFLDEHCPGRGYKVLHDLVADGFNVDHIVIGPGGVFVIETKTNSKPTGAAKITYDGTGVLINGARPDRDPIAQAKACAGHARELLAKTTNRRAETIPVRPVVLYPGWFIQGDSAGREVWVLNENAFLKWIERERLRLSPEDVGLFYLHLSTLNRRAPADVRSD